MTANSRRFRATLAYDGSRYAGFQRQAGGIATIQGVLEASIGQVTQQPIRVKGAGRTDAGVHASGQVIAFDCEWRHPTEALWRAINAALPQDIALQDLQVAAPGFHPRFDAYSRSYRYQFYAAPVRDPLRDHRNWYTGSRPLDERSLRQAAVVLEGLHDFASFGQPTQGEVTLREVYRARLVLIAEQWFHFHISASGFLKHMVRSIVGTLVEVGQGRYSPADFEAALHAADRRRAGKTAPPHGLTLVGVAYDANERVSNESKNLDTQN